MATCPNCNGSYSERQDPALHSGDSDICKHCAAMSEWEKRDVKQANQNKVKIIKKRCCAMIVVY